MKTLRLTIAAIAALSLQCSFAQDTIPTLTIDSTLTVGSNVHVGNKMTIEGETQMSSDATAERDLTVEGDIYAKNNIFVTGNLEVAGMTTLNTTRIAGVLTVSGLTTNTTFDGLDLVVVKSNGTIEKAGLSAISEMSYTKECFTVNGHVPNPTWHNGEDKIFVDCPPVNVGIGTNAPQHKLDVRGIGSFTTGVLAGNVLTTNYTNNALFEGLKLESTNGPLMRLTVRKADGTNEVRFKVEKTGAVYATSVRVRVSNEIPVPDYVFKPGYQLMPLPLVKSYVEINNHLPNIPSEQQIREDGLSLDEMQLLLLQKIEELTLYVIDLNEKSETQTRENAALKAEIEQLKAIIHQQH